MPLIAQLGAQLGLRCGAHLCTLKYLIRFVHEGSFPLTLLVMVLLGGSLFPHLSSRGS